MQFAFGVIAVYSTVMMHSAFGLIALHIHGHWSAGLSCPGQPSCIYPSRTVGIKTTYTWRRGIHASSGDWRNISTCGIAEMLDQQLMDPGCTTNHIPLINSSVEFEVTD